MVLGLLDKERLLVRGANFDGDGRAGEVLDFDYEGVLWTVGL